MKKRTKISLRTKIYLTIVGLLALTGIIYAATPVTFSTFQGLTGLAASKTELFATGFISPETNVYTFSPLLCDGIPLVYQQAPGGEKYVGIAPAQSGAAGFTPDVVHQAMDWNAMAHLVANRLGVALIPRLAQMT